MKPKSAPAQEPDGLFKTSLENLLDGDNTASAIYADSTYGSKVNRQMLEQRGLKAQIHTRKPKGKAMSERASKANGRRSRIRAFVEHPFAHLKSIMKTLA